MLNPQDLAQAESKRHAEQLETSMAIMATTILRKTGRRSLRISQQDIQDAVQQGVVDVKSEDDGETVIYTLPTKNKARRK